MSFVNHITKRINFKRSLFSKPPEDIPDTYILLYSSITDKAIEVNQNTTTSKIIYKGKFDEKILITKKALMQKINISSPSDSDTYNFDVELTFNIFVYNPVVYFYNISNESDKLLKDLVMPIVRKTTKKYNVIEYNNMEDELHAILNNQNDFLDNLGIKCYIYSVQAKPDKEAIVYATRITKALLENETKIVELDTNAKIESTKLENAQKLESTDINSAIISEVVNGKITLEEAINRIDKYHQNKGETSIKNLDQFINMMNKMKNAKLINDIQIQEQTNRFINDFVQSAPLIEKKSVSEVGNFPTEDEIIEKEDEKSE